MKQKICENSRTASLDPKFSGALQKKKCNQCNVFCENLINILHHFLYTMYKAFVTFLDNGVSLKALQNNGKTFLSVSSAGSFEHKNVLEE